MKHVRLPLRVVFYYEHDRWIAHCLEFDLVGDGETQEEALDCLSEAIYLQIDASLEHNNPENLFTPAEGKFFRMFAQGKNVAAGQLQFHFEGFEFDDLEAREYADLEEAVTA